MYCPKCGKQLDDNALFCSECGTRVDGAKPTEETSPSPSKAVAQDKAIPPAGPDASGSQPEARRQRNRHILLAVIAAFVVVALVLVGIYLKQQSDYKKAHAKTDVTFTVVAPGYVSGTDSKIPLHVEGTDLDGKAVSQDAYLSGDGTGLSLMRGTYTVTAVASPLLSNGTIYDTPGAPVAITIDENGLQTPSSQLSITFTVTDPLGITDAQIDAAYSAARASGMDEGTATNLKNAVTQTRAVAQQKKVDDDAATAAAAKKAEEEKAAADSALHYSCEYFELDVPQSWSGRWSCSKTSTTGGYNYSFSEAGTKLYVITVLKVGTSGNNGTVYATTSDGKYNIYEGVSSGSWANHNPDDLAYLESTFKAK